MFKKMPVPERVRIAKEKTKRVVDHLHYLLELHENNAIVLYTRTLSRQIPTSFAANAFRVFQQGMHQFEIVRLYALWDSAALEKENIPTIIKLINHPKVIEALAQETASHWQSRDDQQFGQQEAQKAREELRKAIDDSRAIIASPRHVSIMNWRDKHLAHSLSKTRREKKVGPLPSIKYGDEGKILEATLPIVEVLYCWVNGTSLSFENSRKIDRENAKALWEACSFRITR
jgi:hypothetical protein